MHRDAPVVRTRQGLLRGSLRPTTVVWRGVPYAAPPVGVLRWKAPQPPAPWSGTRDAATFGARAPQVLAPELLPPNSASETDDGAPQSEDCLYLNVCAPRAASDRLPVLVWFHGGGYHWGSGATYSGDGTALAEAGMIVVTPNYRLGALGLLRLDHRFGPTYADAANCTLLDQIAAVRWVRQNIHAFGGDPDRITVGGISAGAKSAVNLMASPLAQGLFHQAVVHSGGDHVATPAESASLADSLFRVLGLPGATEDQLLAVPADDVLAAQQELGSGVQATWLWRPTVDGRVLPMTPTEAFERGRAGGIRMIAGVTSNEAGGYDLAEPSATDQVPEVLSGIFGPRTGEVLDVYRTGRPGAPEREVRRAVLTDERYAIPTIRLLEAQSRHAATWRFVFNAPTPGATPDRWGFHGADMAYLWDVGMADADPGLRSVASSLRQAWANFVASGPPAAHGLPSWPVFSLPDRATLVIEDQPRIERDPRASERALWQHSTWNPGPWWPLPLIPSTQKVTAS